VQKYHHVKEAGILLPSKYYLLVEKQRKFLFDTKYLNCSANQSTALVLKSVCLSHVTECVAHFTGYQYMKTGRNFRGNVEGLLIYLLRNSILECYAYSTKL